MTFAGGSVAGGQRATAKPRELASLLLSGKSLAHKRMVVVNVVIFLFFGRYFKE